MNDGLRWIRDHHVALGWLASASVLMFIGSLILVPIIAARIPSDYFAHQDRPKSQWADQHFVLRGLLFVAKNLAGALLIVMGVAMLVLPGQGLLSLFLGMMLLSFPGKFALERWLISRGPVLRSINWIRRRAGQPELQVDENRPIDLAS